LRAAWRWWLPPALLSFALAFFFRDPFIGDWDGLDYTVLAVRGQPSSMALGRSLFIFANHALYTLAHKLFQLPPEDAYLLFKFTVICLTPLVVISCWTLAREVTDSNRTATIAALLVTASPTFILYSGQVMTDVPSLLFVALALSIHLRGLLSGRWWMLMLGAALLGAGANVRETVAFYAPWLMLAPFVCGWKFGRRELALIALSCLVFALFAFGPFALWFWTDASGFRDSWYSWRDSGAAEAARHPVTISNALPFLLYSFILGPLICIALPFAIWKEWRARGLTPLLLLALAGMWANFLLFFNYSTVLNWRYFLTGLPALAPLVADYFMRSETMKLGNARRAFWTNVLGIAFVLLLVAVYASPTSRENISKRALTKEYRSRLALLPPDAVVLAGGQTVAVTYWRGIGMGQWTEIGTGAGWPGAQLDSLIETYLKDGRRVFLDQDPRWWAPCGWQLEETLQLIRLESRFHFRRLSDTIYEIRPRDDEAAHDTPNLQSLRPENRPSETKKCLGLNTGK
jgi:4-amino-4-deoxy-L-arabinose transferase-like glycosyltransferase